MQLDGVNQIWIKWKLGKNKPDFVIYNLNFYLSSVHNWESLQLWHIKIIFLQSWRSIQTPDNEIVRRKYWNIWRKIFCFKKIKIKTKISCIIIWRLKKYFCMKKRISVQEEKYFCMMKKSIFFFINILTNAVGWQAGRVELQE